MNYKGNEKGIKNFENNNLWYYLKENVEITKVYFGETMNKELNQI